MNKEKTREKGARPSQGSVSVGHPVNVATGTLYHEFQDCELVGRIPLIFPRRYSTALLDKKAGIFGVGWHCSFDLKIIRDLDGYVLTDPSGEVDITFNVTYEQIKKRETVRNEGVFYELCREGNELRITHWDVETGDIQHDFFPLPEDNNKWVSIVRREDAEGNALHFSYNKEQQLTLVSQERERRGLKLEYNDKDLLTNVYRVSAILDDGEQEAEAYLQYRYDDNGHLLQFTDPLGEHSYYTYDDNSRMVSECTLGDMVYAFKFDKQGRCNYLSGVDDFDLNKLEYNDLSRITAVTDSSGNTVNYHWNEVKQVEKVISPKGHASTTMYDDYDRIIAEVDSGGATTAYTYDNYGNRDSITAPDGATVKYTFNDQHQATVIADPSGNKWKRSYDESGHLTSIKNPLKVSQVFIYNDKGDLTEHKDGVGNAREFHWDENGNLANVSDWSGNKSYYKWDTFGDLIQYKDAAEHKTKMARDRTGQLLKLTLPDGNERKYKWDSYDNLEEYIDENKVKTRWAYCACGNIEEEFKPDGNKIAYGWNAIPGQLAHLTNEKGELYHFDYNEEGQLVKETDFSGAVTEYEYNKSGQISKSKKPSGYISRYRHDDVGRITEVKHDDGSAVKYEYDARGLLVKADNMDCPVSFEYDVLGRLIKETQGKHSIEHKYDELNNRIIRKSSLGDTTEFAWNPNGQIASVQTEGFDSVEFEYDARGYESKRMLASDMVFEQQVDQRGRLIKQTLNNTPSDKPNDPIERQYQYDAASNLLTKQDSMWGTTKYTYDILERIDTTLHPDKLLERFSYDDNSNITSHQELKVRPDTDLNEITNIYRKWKYEKGNKLVEREGIPYEYDDDGQLVCKTDDDGKTQYHWNRLGQLTSIQKPDGEEWFYRYDALSRRVEKRGPKTQIEYIWDGDVILYEINHADNDVDAYTHAWEYHPHDFSPLYKLENRKEQFFSLNDQIGTPLELLDGKGGVAWSARLEAFGKVKSKAQNVIGCPIRFQGQWEDAESDFYYNRFRYFHSKANRYIQPDPVKLNGGINQYIYTCNSAFYIDPLGLTSGSCPLDKKTRKTRELTTEELNHGFDRHAAELLGHSVTRTRDFSRFASIVNRARKSNLTFHARSGGSQTIAHLARVDGQYVVVHFHTEGARSGTLASIWRPSQKQLSSYFEAMSRSGP